MVELCYRTHKVIVNPLIDWTNEDIWEFIKIYHIPYCGLYDEGCSRLGCICCPLGNSNSMKRELQRWPQYKAFYIKTFDAMIERRKERGMKLGHPLWQDGEGVMRWWIGEYENQAIGQTYLFDEESIEDI